MCIKNIGKNKPLQTPRGKLGINQETFIKNILWTDVYIGHT